VAAFFDILLLGDEEVSIPQSYDRQRKLPRMFSFYPMYLWKRGRKTASSRADFGIHSITGQFSRLRTGRKKRNDNIVDWLHLATRTSF
jgi:hypothetical protein